MATPGLQRAGLGTPNGSIKALISAVNCRPHGSHAAQPGFLTDPMRAGKAGAPNCPRAAVPRAGRPAGGVRPGITRLAVAERRDQARAELQETALQVASEVWHAYYAFQTAMKKYQYAEVLLQASQSSYDSNYKSFGHGLVNIIDLLAAERDLGTAKYTIIQSRADVLVTAATVAYATGAISTLPPK